MQSTATGLFQRKGVQKKLVIFHFYYFLKLGGFLGCKKAGFHFYYFLKLGIGFLEDEKELLKLLSNFNVLCKSLFQERKNLCLTILTLRSCIFFCDFT